tara:strand:- start:141 stop:434 length:294 start_codon:yes stop_codon:yes gene_type:complete
MCGLAWDQALMRKYSNTGHFRLLNQLRNELKKDPIVRPKAEERVEEAAQSRTVEVRPQHLNYQNRNPRRGAPSTAAPRSSESSPTSFRERLNAIEMR